ncbi:DUF3093 domain-containing protein [Cellulomonas fimi]|uniref:DUF3093 domain-containing protein n=1 Tax=Cellulomonas fimi (strain ATCC 484 / DSM 20113 / JCM 1341 / CCUG 24087 / LMG 16345 / NBRC 15513 / NCIMB 8980 / NCTC 7547 / NRS-133) TaxID=590998 RepID=F4H1H8_CELFA|nr:DUF3093 domain-containing protein [Cellulomonas fimi]AEE46277.1 hypothetical protein Celf_2149 [Cellulomonas fimi ATCC 484]NNH06216.1 DUF3093 domain-containing protein [Cellulomonas fimi]VEH32338.1 Protein of uncharacterised function (DUF3093) [Cellulomonas fimi]
MPDSAVPPAVLPASSWSERLWPGPWGWVLLVVFTLMLGVVLLPVDATLAAVVGLVALGAGLAVTVALTPTVRVADGSLRAGSARIPLSLLGTVTELDADALRRELGPDLDARAHVCLRGWIRSAVRVELLDPQDPTPYWLVSTRRPHELAQAIRAGATVR